MEIKECDKVVTLCDKKFDNGFIPRGTIGYVTFVKIIDNKECYILEIFGINDDNPLFEYNCDEIVKCI